MKTENKQVTLDDRLKEAQDRFGFCPDLEIKANKSENELVFIARSTKYDSNCIDHFVKIHFDPNHNNSASRIQTGFMYHENHENPDLDFCTNMVVNLDELDHFNHQMLKVAQHHCDTVLSPWGDKTFVQNVLFDVTAYYIDQYSNVKLYVHFDQEQLYKPTLSFSPHAYAYRCDDLYDNQRNYAFEFGINQALYGATTLYGKDSAPIYETFPEVSEAILKYNEDYLHLPIKENTMSSYNLPMSNTIPTVGNEIYVLAGPVIHKMTVDSVEIRADDIYLSGETDCGSLKVSLPNAFRTEIAAEMVRNQRFPEYSAENEQENAELE